MKYAMNSRITRCISAYLDIEDIIINLQRDMYGIDNLDRKSVV